MQILFQLLSMKCWKSHFFSEIYPIFHLLAFFYLLAVFFFNLWWKKYYLYSPAEHYQLGCNSPLNSHRGGNKSLSHICLSFSWFSHQRPLCQRRKVPIQDLPHPRSNMITSANAWISVVCTDLRLAGILHVCRAFRGAAWTIQHLHAHHFSAIS